MGKSLYCVSTQLHHSFFYCSFILQCAQKKKQAEIQDLQEDLSHVDVLAEVDGVVQSISEDSGTAYMTIMETGVLQVKGTASEMTLWSLTEGEAMTVRSRLDKTQTWSGSISAINTDSTEDDSESDYYYDDETSGESASNYSFTVTLDSTDDMTTAGKKAAEILNANLSDTVDPTYSYQSTDLEEAARSLQQMSATSNQQLIWIASISLLVGGIGVMNIMLVSVTERTREIGLKKALGAKRGRILWQFLTEAAVLTSIGGLLGVVTGLGLARVISSLTGTPTAVSLLSILVAVLFSVVIGVVFGLLPAVKAANLNPIDALRRE